ncbi:hypothetical protein PVK06_035968 [Gossypium arboreum]|uniref:Uncharacterized protein n=1 Tax=Gossypium arboreum TaxID=29729 RepID=A0ABR0NI82_GOSAR|nr:hypothetical protein PVK06_035968 [Gossypium arboreum]
MPFPYFIFQIPVKQRLDNIEKNEVLERMKLDLNYSSKWRKRNNVAADIEVLIGTENEDEVESSTDSVATSSTTSRPSQVAQTRVLEHLDEGIASLDKIIWYFENRLKVFQ